MNYETSYRKCTYPVVFAFEEHPSGVLRRARSEPQHFPRAVVALYERHRQATKTLRERRARWTAGRVHARKPSAAAGGRTRACMRRCALAWAAGEAPRPLHRLGQQPAAGKSQIRRPAMKCRRSANPAARRRRGEGRGGLVRVAAFRRAPAGCGRRNLGRRPAAAREGRGEVVGGRKRGMKCPPTNRFRLYAGHRSREGETRVFPGWGRMRGLVRQVFQPIPAFWQLFCGSGADAGSARVALRV